MRKSVTVACLMGAYLVVSACAPNMANVAPERFGSPPQGDTLVVIKNFMETRLFDAGSAKYRKVGGAVQGWTREALIMGGKLEYGYAECWMINAKNRFGGYVGYKPYLFLLRGQRLVGWSPNPQLSSWNCF